MTVRGFRLAFDWSRGGGYTGTLEDVSSYVSAGTDITVTVGRDTSRAASQIPAGTFEFVLEDQGLNFAPEKSTSPIVGKVLPGTPAVFDVTVTGATTVLHSGDLDDFVYDPGARTLSGTVMDAWGAPGAEQLSTPVYTGMRTGELIAVILDAIGWPAGAARDLDSGATVVPYWWAEGKDAATAVQELVDSEGPPAIAYVEAGTFVFRDRHHRLLRAASQNSQATFTHIYPEGTGPGGDFKVLRDSFTYSHGLRSIVNSATFEVGIREPGGLSRVWSSESTITIPANGSTVIEAQGTEPFINAAVPVLTTNINDDGTPNGDYTVGEGTVTVTLDRDSGQSVLITLTAGGADATVTSLALRACPVPVARTVKVGAEDTGSVASIGRQSWDRPLPWANQYDAQAIAQRIVATYATARPVVTFSIDGAISATYLAQFAARRISDRITVRNDIVGINGPFIVERIQRSVQQLGIRTRLTITCETPEPVQAVNAFTFDVAGKGFNQGAFAVDGIDDAASVFRFDTAGQGFDQGKFAS